MQEALIMLALVIQRFKVECPNSDKVRMGVCPMLRPVNFAVKFTPRF